MPTGYQRHSTGPMRAASGGFIAPVDDTANDLLRARAATTNDEPFTAEHRAAYHQFAAVTDRADALALHRGRVSWDDVNAYGQAGLPFTAYQRMITLRRQGITPDVFQTWRTALRSISDADLAVYHRAGLTPAQVVPYRATREGKAMVDPRDWANIPTLIANEVSALRCWYWRQRGIDRAAEMIELQRLGATPKVLKAYRANGGTTNTNRFAGLYRRCANLPGATPAIVNAVLSGGGTHATVRDWIRTGQPADRVALYVLCGITPEEFTANPDLADATGEQLASLAALRGHTVTVPRETLALSA